MGEILFGMLVMVAFIGFVIWKNKGKEKQAETMDDLHRQQWWAEKDQENQQGVQVVSSDSGDDSDNDD